MSGRFNPDVLWQLLLGAELAGRYEVRTTPPPPGTPRFTQEVFLEKQRITLQWPRQMLASWDVTPVEIGE